MGVIQLLLNVFSCLINGYDVNMPRKIHGKSSREGGLHYSIFNLVTRLACWIGKNGMNAK